MFEIQSGVTNDALKGVIFGVEGIGKSTLASQFPNALFIDTEDSTKRMDVKRLKKPSSFTELMEMLEWVKKTKPCSTLIIDTADWAQTLAEKEVLSENGWNSIEAPGYGEGYVKVREKYGKMLDKLSDVADAGINVVLTAHAEIKKFEDPTELGAYDRYELKLAKRSNAHIANVTKEWADMVLFLNYDVYAVKREGMGEKYQAQGGQRMMFTTRMPAYDAKNRFGLPDKLPLDYSHIAHIVPDLISSQQQPVSPFTGQAPTNELPTQPEVTQPTQSATIEHKAELQQALGIEPEIPFTMNEPTDYPSYLPNQLTDLMKANSVTLDELSGVMGLRGHFPINTDFEVIANNSPEYFIGGLAANWEMVMDVVQSIRQDPTQLVDLFTKVGEPDPQAKVANMSIAKG